MSDAILKAESLVKIYGHGPRQTEVLKGVDFSAHAGESIAVVGPSGAGKTTLLYLLGGLAHPTSGKVWLQNQEMYAMGDEALSHCRSASLGFVFQFHHLLPELDALDNVALPIMMAGSSRSEARERAHKILEEVGLIQRASHKPGELSGGEQQRVAIGRALANNPAVLLTDEPTGNLDRVTAESIHDLLISTAAERNQVLIMVTHNEALARRARRVVRMVDGRIVHEG
jgi:lipoprotein-releasing system ATP-binding protein